MSVTGPRHDDGDDRELAAGRFSVWLVDTRAAIAGERDAVVPCDGCTACCRSSQFVHVGPDEHDARAHIPAALLFPAPQLPPGHHVLGYDRDGRCPMLAGDACSIYEHRPRACRTYDCRVYPAAGVGLAGDGSKVRIARQSARWRFEHPTPDDHVRHRATQAAAAFIRDHAAELPLAPTAMNATRLAVLAVELADLFVGPDTETGAPVVSDPGVAAVAAALGVLD